MLIELGGRGLTHDWEKHTTMFMEPLVIYELSFSFVCGSQLSTCCQVLKDLSFFFKTKELSIVVTNANEPSRASNLSWQKKEQVKPLHHRHPRPLLHHEGHLSS